MFQTSMHKIGMEYWYIVLVPVTSDQISSLWDHGIKGVAVGLVVNVVLAASGSAQPTGARSDGICTLIWQCH